MITTSDFYDAFARWLTDQGVAQYVTSGIYGSSGLPGVVIGPLSDTPGSVIGLTVYDHDTRRSDRGNPDIYIQARFRTPGMDPRPVDDLADQLANILHDKTHITFPGGVRVLHAYRTIRGPVVADDSGQRRERPDSYRLTLNPL